MNEAVRVHARRDERASCGYCRAEVSPSVGAPGSLPSQVGASSERPASSCPRCGVLVHTECLIELRGCPTLGCETPTRRFLGAPALFARPSASAAPRAAEAGRAAAFAPGSVRRTAAPRSAAPVRASSLRGALALLGYFLHGMAPSRPALWVRLAVAPFLTVGVLYGILPAFGGTPTRAGPIALAILALLVVYLLLSPLGRLLQWTSRPGTPDEPT